MPTFEEIIGIRLREMFPCGVLSSIPVFRPDRGDNSSAYEIDHLVHIRDGELDTLFIIECKEPPVTGPHFAPPVPGGPWFVEYHNRQTGQRSQKDCRQQIINHAVALIHFFEGYKRKGRLLRIEACVICPQTRTPNVHDPLNAQVRLHLSNPEQLLTALNRRKALRVEQSALLSQLRAGLRDENVGHPAIRDSIEFIARSRNALDLSLYKLFRPTKKCWAINGSAGMGKSALLAYTLFVLATDKQVVTNDVDLAIFSRHLEGFESEAKELGLPLLMQRSIHAMALKSKQVEVLRGFWERYRREFSALGDASELRFNEPVFHRWTGAPPQECNVLLIDEAHDLDEAAQTRIAEWLNDADENRPRYLVIACDRHQKLRLVGSNARLISGLTFTNRTTRLKRNYRNPFPVFCAGLSIMFRWFAEYGPKILPKRDQLEGGFGLDVAEYSTTPGGFLSLGLRNDSHPANHWFYTATLHESTADAYSLLQEARLGSQDVLWVRFSQEDTLFDYELLSGFTYHNCCTFEAFEIVDKYVKGQEYPVVVIEGVPSSLNAWENNNLNTLEEIDDKEIAMWRARRVLYLCASRATAFLIFVAGEAQALSPPVRKELHSLIGQLGLPKKASAADCRWGFDFSATNCSREMDVFDEGQFTPDTIAITNQLLASFESADDLTTANLAIQLGIDAELLLRDLQNILTEKAFSLDSHQALARGKVIPFDLAVEAAQKYDARIEINGLDISTAVAPPPAVQDEVTDAQKGVITLPDRPTIRELARVLGLQPSEVIPGVTNVNFKVENSKVEELLGNHGIAVTFENIPLNELTSTAKILPASLAPVVIASSPATNALLQLVQDRRILFGTAIERYMAFLKTLLLNDGNAESTMLNHSRGRHRVQFARTAAEINASGNTTNPRQIPGTRVYALTNLSNESKRSIANELLGSLKYSMQLRQTICNWIMGRSARISYPLSCLIRRPQQKKLAHPFHHTCAEAEIETGSFCLTYRSHNCTTKAAGSSVMAVRNSPNLNKDSRGRTSSKKMLRASFLSAVP